MFVSNQKDLYDKGDDLPKQTILEHLWMLIFSSPPQKKGDKKGRWKILLIWRLSWLVDCESISSSIYTQVNLHPSYLWNFPSAQIPWLSFWWLSNLFFSPHIPFPIRTTTDHNPQQQPTPTRRDKFFDKFVVILLVLLLLLLLLLPSFPYPPFLNVGIIFYLVQLCFATFRPPS
jgi:hypothetical protein